VEVPQTRYARSGDVSIAYQVVGDGPIDFVWSPGFVQHVELSWEEPYRAHWFRRLAEQFRLILFDKRGTGLSDRFVGEPSLETRMDDIRAVLDAVQSERAVIAAGGDAGPLAVLFAATYPARTRALVLASTWARQIWAPDYPWGPPREDVLARVADMERRWGHALVMERVREAAPSLTEEECEAFARIIRLSVSPSAAAAYERANVDVDVRDVLSAVRVPTLVLQRRGRAPEPGRVLAERIPDAKLVEVPGDDFIPVVGNADALLDEIIRFVEQTDPEPEPERVLATVLFTDLVDSTAKAADLGDRAWTRLLQDHHARIRRELVRFRGVEHDTAGDGFFASFDGPARAIRCACAIRGAMLELELDLDLRAGLHTGECELLDGKVAGIAVSIGARVAAQAAPGDVLVSQTVKDLVAGSGIGFQDRGAAELKGIPGEWRLYAVA
jgi:class 3 adenylate cyclase/pimeloyl-ACP methyl ester carboxylesterase